MRYNDVLNYNSTANYTNYAYSANSAFDPYQGAGGHQPRGFDQWSQFYNHYIVISSKMTVTASVLVPIEQTVHVAITESDDTALVTTNGITSLEEGGKATWACIANTTAGGADNQKSLSRTWSSKKWFGYANVSDNFDQLGASVAENPPDQAFFMLAVGSPNFVSFTNPVLMNLDVMIEYLVMFREPKDLPVS